MSPTDDVITVSHEALKVEKSFSTDEFPVPAVSLRIHSTDDRPVSVRLVDQIPESFPMDRIGFHPDYGSDNWTAYRDNRVEFRTTLEPGEEVTTVYGVRTDDPSDLDDFRTEPEIEESSEETGAEDIEDILGADSSQAVRDVLSGERSTLPGMDAESDAAEEAESDEEPAVDPLAEPSEASTDPLAEPEETAADPLADPEDALSETEPAVDESFEPEAGESSDATGEADDVSLDAEIPSEDQLGEPEPADEPPEEPPDEEPEPAAEPDTGAEPEPGAAAMAADKTSTEGAGSISIAAALANELRDGSVSDSDLELLRDELGTGVPQSVDVRLNRLQARLADLDAYTDALEAFINENGTAEGVLSDLREDIDAVTDTVSALESDLDSVESNVEAGQDERDALEAVTDELEEETESLTAQTDALEANVADVESDLAAVASDSESNAESIESLESDVASLREHVDDLFTAKQDAEADLEALEEQVLSVQSEIEELDAELDAIDDDIAESVEDLKADVEEIHERMDDFDQFKTRLSSAFGDM